MSELVDVGGYRLAVSVSGSGPPPVVFLSGVTGDQREWGGVQAAMSAPVTQIAYARPALGGSEPLPPGLAAEHAAGWAAGQLRTLLRRLAVPGPYVLASHSVAGLIAEAYAARWPADTAGLVLVDPSHPDFGGADDVLVDHEPGGIRFSMAASRAERASFPAPPAIPVVVVSGAVGRWLEVTEPEYLAGLSPAEADERWQGLQRDWVARTRAAHVIAHKAGHSVHDEAPRLVAYLIDQVVAAARDGHGLVLDPTVVDTVGGFVATVVNPGLAPTSETPGADAAAR